MRRNNLIQRQFSNQQMLLINIFSSMANLMVTMGISFFVSPYIVRTLGAEASGFTSLASNFTSYASIVQVALNSMGSRFVTISYIKGEREQANKYYSALFYGNMLLGLLFTVIALVIVWRVEYMINISPELVMDVKILFGLVFFSYILNTYTSVWLTATFITNKIYLDKVKEIQGIFIRLIVTVVGLLCFAPKIYYAALGAACGTILTNCYSFYYKKVLVPDLRASRKEFSFTYIKQILASGVWNSISSMGNLFFSGLDLLVTNLFIGGTEMGILAISKTLPNMASSLNATLQGVFTPQLVGDYARGGNQAVAKTLIKSSRIVMIVCIIPLCFLIVYGEAFYSLWQPTQNARQLQILSVLACASSAITTCAMSFYNVFTVLDKVKQSSIATLITGAASFLVTYVLISKTELGIYAVAAVSSVMYSMRSLVFAIPMIAKYLGMKWTKFYPLALWNIVAVSINCTIGYILKMMLPSDTWIFMILSAFVFGIICVAVNCFVLLEHEDRKRIWAIVQKKIKR